MRGIGALFSLGRPAFATSVSVALPVIFSFALPRGVCRRGTGARVEEGGAEQPPEGGQQAARDV